jgi:hypothetical protein
MISNFYVAHPRYPISHKLLLAGAESVPELTLNRVAGYRRSHRGETTHHLFALSRTLRIRQSYGFGFSTAHSISPLPTIRNYSSARSDFHAVSRAAALNGSSMRPLK